MKTTGSRGYKELQRNNCTSGLRRSIALLRPSGNRSPTLVVALTLATVAGPASAITIDATDSGFVTVAGGSSKGDGTVSAATYNYSVGQELHYPDGALFSMPFVHMDRNNYFVFDLGGLSGTIVSAKLRIAAGILETDAGPTETFDLIAPSDSGAALSDATMLLIGNGIGPSEFDEPTDPLVGVAGALYGNIEGGTGSVLGTAVISSADDGSAIEIPLAPPGIGYIESFLGGPLFLGGSVSSIDTADMTEQPFGGVEPDIPGDVLVPELEITFASQAVIPEPSTLTLAVLGLLSLGRTTQRRRRA